MFAIMQFRQNMINLMSFEGRSTEYDRHLQSLQHQLRESITRLLVSDSVREKGTWSDGLVGGSAVC